MDGSKEIAMIDNDEPSMISEGRETSYSFVQMRQSSFPFLDSEVCFLIRVGGEVEVTVLVGEWGV